VNDFLPSLRIADYSYHLPEDRIAAFPEHPRHNSRLLVNDHNNLSDHYFYQLPDLLDPDTFLVFNNTRVIPARLIFSLEGEKHIEVFLVKPLNAEWTDWECQIGNRRKFKDGITLRAEVTKDDQQYWLEASWISRDENRVHLASADGLNMHEVLDLFGRVPLPPYIKRDVTSEDKADYQTIFAQNAGAVAAPTASLHYTPEVMQSIREKGISADFLTLHVGLGTFKPVTAATSDGHAMHQEAFEVTADFIGNLLQNLHKKITPSGTTAMRVLESLYYVGAKALLGRKSPHLIPRDAGFDPELNAFDVEHALRATLQLAQTNGGTITGETSIFILPGFPFRLSKALITNFHQPGSTLLLLVAAFVGTGWQKMYEKAIEKRYRFLSYGDATLLVP
jgi:S-adenosylmethionine:tRNA ribosyltransferase-isomerase